MIARKQPVSERDPLWYQIVSWAVVGVVVMVTVIIASAVLGELLAWIVELVLG